MTLATRTALAVALSLLLPLAGRALAQEPVPTSTDGAAVESSDSTPTGGEASETVNLETVPAETSAEEVSESGARDQYAVRSELNQLLREHHRDLTHVLVIDPDLLANESYMAEYPALARFLAANPEVTENPRFYMAEWGDPRLRDDDLNDILEGMVILATFGLIAVALAWIIRTILEQKRWNRLSRTQTEVHNKILDRFGSSEELIEYMKSPAGSKFLEAAPIPVRTASTSVSPPMSRLMISIQIGVVVVATGLGMMLIAIPLEGESAVTMFSLGAIAFCVGAGFIASAAVSLTMSRRLGIWQDPSAQNQLHEPEQLR